ncbi:MAG: cadherin repeat domain-containing protein, partial [Gammaproteobacteria bacterium]|nr:cadherin repeat domain-containing protein [Gammaproteobacteria bacterium]
TPQVLAENLAIATTIGSFSATDKGTNTHTYTLVAGEGDTDNNAFSISGNSLQSALVFNYEEKNNYSIRVRVTDHTNLWFEKIFQIDVTDVDEIPPVFESGFPLVDNIGESEAELKIQMNELGTVYFVIVESGADAPTAQQVRNGLNASNGFAALKGSFKVEYAAPTITAFTIQLAEASNYDAYIVAHDDVSQANLQTIATKFSFSIKDRPTQLSLSPATMMEGNIAGDIVGRLSAVDEDSIALTYVLIDGEGADDNEQFMIVGDLLRTNISFDYELVTQYNIRVQVRDNDGLSSEQAFVINVSDIDDTAPIFENNYPSARVLTENSFELALKANETSEAFVLLYKAGEIEPSKAQIMMKDPYLDDGLTVFYHEVHQLSANTEATIPITGLLASTHYQVVIIAQDDELKPNIQTDISKLSITTADRQLSKDSKLFAVDGVSILMFVMMILLVMKRKISLVKIRL